MPRFKDYDWNVGSENQLGNYSWDQVKTSILLDLRDELQKMNSKLSVLRCPNFISIPIKLDRISKNTSKPKLKPKPARRKRISHGTV